MNKFFNVGDVLYGFCNGFFGRDDYDDKICVMVTKKYAVFQYLEKPLKGQGVILNHSETLSKQMVKEWKNKQ